MAGTSVVGTSTRTPDPTPASSAGTIPTPSAATGLAVISTAGMTAEAAANIVASQAAANSTMLAQSAIAQIQNEIALNQAMNSVIEELGKGVKALAQ